MKLRPPAWPLFTNDPYFSVWSTSDALNGDVTRHWSCKPQPLTGLLNVDGKLLCFMGRADGAEPMSQTGACLNACTTKYTFEGAGVRLTVKFTSPLLLDNIVVMARPISYMCLSIEPLDGRLHNVTACLRADEELCLDYKNEMPVETTVSVSKDGLRYGRMGSIAQPVLCKSGDDLRINWGYFYMTAAGCPCVTAVDGPDGASVEVSAALPANGRALFAVGYDDIYSFEYFGQRRRGYYKWECEDFALLLRRALNEYDDIYARCEDFSSTLHNDAEACGGSQYAELLDLAYRQTISAHKLTTDPEGRLLLISKENFSNGCAATVDVTYPSIPLFLLYNPALVTAMLRPPLTFAATDNWPHPFAPHDAGQYPLINGQVYGMKNGLRSQMPVEECGNMLICAAALTLAGRNSTWKNFHLSSDDMELMKGWADYLAEAGVDLGEELCTDDFAGHLARNANLAVKGVVGVMAYAILLRECGRRGEADGYEAKARSMAADWCALAPNEDGTLCLAFGSPDSYSLKYNMAWDVLFGTRLFPDEMIRKEAGSYLKKRALKYGVPLDSRRTWTKSDWMLWAACLSDDPKDLSGMAALLWKAYNETDSRVPMTDMYDAVTAKHRNFQARSVQGGLFMGLLKAKGLCSINVD